MEENGKFAGNPHKTGVLLSYTPEQAAAERMEDLLELAWLLAECRHKLQQIEQTAQAEPPPVPVPAGPAAQGAELVPIAFYHSRIQDLERIIRFYQKAPGQCSTRRFLQAKYEIRILLKQLAGIVSSSDWQSPSITRSPIKEKGFRQMEQNVYLRTSGSEYVKRFERELFTEFYAMSDEMRSRSIAFLTNSGMKALEVALMVYRLLSESRLPIYHQVGYYFEGITLIRDLHPEAEPVSVERIYKMLDNGEEIGCLLLEPGTTWPAHEGVRLDILFAKLKRHRQQKPLFLVIDRTLTGITNQFFDAYAERLPGHVTLVSIESGIKYWQFGMELTNLGFLVLCGERMGDPTARGLIIHCMNVLTGVPDPSLVRRLPRPSLTMLERRMARLARNMNVLYDFFHRQLENGRIARLYHSVQSANRFLIRGEPWRGSLIYAQLPGVVSFRDYERLAEQWVGRAAPSLHLHLGGSFGFDTMRLCAVEESPEREDNSALRLSVGRDTIDELERKLKFFDGLFA